MTTDLIVAKEHTVSTLSPAVRRRRAMEYFVIGRVCNALIAAGHTVSTDNLEDDGTAGPFKDWKDIRPHLMQCDEERLIVHTEGKKNRIIMLVYGNDGYDVVADHSGSLSEILDPVLENIEDVIAQRMGDLLADSEGV